MQYLEMIDVERMIKLVAEASDPTLEMPLLDRKRRLMQGAAELVQADCWIWSTATMHPEGEPDVMTFGFLDGGWDNEQQRVRAMRELTDPKLNELIVGPVIDCVGRQRYTTFFESDLVAPEMLAKLNTAWRVTGLAYCLMPVYPLSKTAYSAAGFHRKIDRQPFTERERLIAHTIFQQVDWLHREGTNVKAQDRVVHLSPRERHVLCFLMSGDSRKQIAAKLKLSEHTVGDYLKGIYKRFEVNSRSELLAQFIAGGQN